MAIAINCDIGEGYGLYTFGNDERIMPFISIANVACGFHASDPSVMHTTVRLALAHGVKVGAHPSLPDRQGFGRREMQMEREELRDLLIYQVGALKGFLEAAGAPLNHIKPHGALFGMTSKYEPCLSGCHPHPLYVWRGVEWPGRGTKRGWMSRSVKTFRFRGRFLSSSDFSRMARPVPPTLLAMSPLPLTPSFTRAIGSTLDVVGVGDNRIGTNQTMDGPGCLSDPAAGERARRVQHHGAGLQHPPRHLAGRCSRLDRRREGMRRESDQNRAPHIDPRRPGAPSTALPAPNRQITWDHRESWSPKPPSPPPPEFSHGLDGVAAGKPVLVLQPLEDPLRRVAQLARDVRIRVRLQERVDDTG